jgi:membrane dipeptidase
VDEHFDLADPRWSSAGGNFNLDSARKGNLGAEFFSIWVDPAQYKGQYARRTLELIDSVKQQVARHPTSWSSSPRPAGIEEAHRERKLAVLMGIEGGHSIENSIPLLRQYYALGVRYMTLTWTNSNGWADSSGDIDDKSRPAHQRGPDRVRQRRGLRDEPAGHDGGHLARLRPHLLPHPGHQPRAGHRLALLARALCDAPRNMTDDMLRAVANSGGPNSKGGVVQVNFYSGFLSQAYRDAQKPSSRR